MRFECLYSLEIVDWMQINRFWSSVLLLYRPIALESRQNHELDQFRLFSMPTLLTNRGLERFLARKSVE